METVGPWDYRLTDLEGQVVGEAVVSLNDGDLLVGLRPADAHPQDETAIITVEGRANGSVAIHIMDRDGNRIHMQVVEPPVKQPQKYTWGYHGSDTSHVHVATADRNLGGELFDVALYDREVVDTKTGVDGEEQSLRDLRKLIGYANAAIEAGLDPEPVQDKTT